LDEFKIRGDLEEVALMKSVLNWISCIHRIFLTSQLFFLHDKSFWVLL
jgi:hypothetical protein